MRVSIRKAVSKLHTVWIAGFEEVAKMEFVCAPHLLVFAVGFRVQDLGASPPPFVFLGFLVANLHPIII